jgi:manganese efflux pump family protein
MILFGIFDNPLQADYSPARLVARTAIDSLREVYVTGLATLVLAFSMSMDAFAAALGRGGALQGPPFIEALRAGFIFGVVEAVMPLVGWLAGSFAAAWITQVDHWLAFFILGWLGVSMGWGALRTRDGRSSPNRNTISRLVVTAVATSIDAMAVGLSLAFIGSHIVTAAAAIGFATFLMATTGTLIGRWTGPMLGRCAEFAGGMCLIVIGSRILVEHLGATG